MPGRSSLITSSCGSSLPRGSRGWRGIIGGSVRRILKKMRLRSSLNSVQEDEASHRLARRSIPSIREHEMKRREALAFCGATTFSALAAASATSDHPSDQDHIAGPLGSMHLYLCAFHIAKKDPKLV